MNPHPLQPKPLPSSHQPFSFASSPQLFQVGDNSTADTPLHAASAVTLNDPWAVADSNLPKAPPRTASLRNSSFTTADSTVESVPGGRAVQPSAMDTPVHRAKHSKIHISPSGPMGIMSSLTDKDTPVDEEEGRGLISAMSSKNTETSISGVASEDCVNLAASETYTNHERTSTSDAMFPQAGSSGSAHRDESNPPEFDSNLVTDPTILHKEDSRQPPFQASATESNLTATESPRSPNTPGDAPPPSTNEPISSSHTLSNNEAPPKRHTSSPTSYPPSCRPPIETSLDTGLRLSPQIGQKSPKAVRRSASSASTSPVLRLKKSRDTPEHRPTSEFVVLEPLSPEHGQELNQQYEFLRRTLSHSQRRYSRKGRYPKQRKNQNAGETAATAGENSNIAVSGLIQSQVAPSSPSTSRPSSTSPSSSSTSPTPSSSANENLSRTARQRQAIGQLQSIVRESGNATPTTSSRQEGRGLREGLEERVDQHGRVYYMNHLTRTIAFGNRGGANPAEDTPTQADMQTRREMLDRRWASYGVISWSGWISKVP